MEVYDEYDQPQRLVSTYCQQVSTAEYDRQTTTETERGLRELMDYLEKNPTVYKKVLVKKKQEEAENAGLFSYMKCKVLETVRGPDYMQDEVSNEETLCKLGELQYQMANVYNYTQEANKSKKRFSRRLAAKKAKANQNKNKTTPRTTPNTTPMTTPTGTPANFKKPTKKAASSTKRRAPPPPTPPPTAPPPPPYPPPSVSSPTTSDDDEVFIRSVLAITPCRRPPLHPDSSSLSSLSPDCGGSLLAPPRPPPPPPPLPSARKDNGRMALQERTNIQDQAKLDSPIHKSTPMKPALTPKPQLTPFSRSTLKRSGSTSSISSISSVHDELLSFDRSRLKSVSSTKSPGGQTFKTPQSKRRVLSASVARASVSDVRGLSATAFNQKMLEKFRNARSPVVGTSSPASGLASPASGFNSPTGFTP